MRCDPFSWSLVPVLRCRVADPIAKEAFPLTKATGARGGGELNVKNNTSLWAALCFNAVGALCVSRIFNQDAFFFVLNSMQPVLLVRNGCCTGMDVGGDHLLRMHVYVTYAAEVNGEVMGVIRRWY